MKTEIKHPKVFSENGNQLFFDEQGNLIKEEPKQETLEERAARYDNIKLPIPYGYVGAANDFINGAKWQSERMYSEEEVREIIKLSCEEGMFIQRTINDKVKIPYTRIKDFTIKMFEQFKKK